MGVLDGRDESAAWIRPVCGARAQRELNTRLAARYSAPQFIWIHPRRMVSRGSRSRSAIPYGRAVGLRYLS